MLLAEHRGGLLCKTHPSSAEERRVSLGVDLQAAINRFLVEHNKKPEPFTWTADPDKIIAAVKRGHQALDSVRSHVRHYKMQE
jgi:hypothetical protein